MLYFDCLSSIFNVFFLIILQCLPFGWQIKPACTHFPGQTKSWLSSFKASQRKQDMKISLKVENWKLSCMIILIATLDEQFKNFNSTHQWKQTAENNAEKNDCCNSVRPYVFIIKRGWNVRNGIRTHAYESRLRPERSALDRSAVLTYTWLNVKSLHIFVARVACPS